MEDDDNITLNLTSLGVNFTSPIGILSFKCSVFSQFIIHTVIFSTLGCLGLVGNVICMIVLARDQQSRVASLLLQAIAVVDNVLLVLWLVRFACTHFLLHTKYYQMITYGWKMTLLVVGPLLYISQMAAIWLTVLIALTRYISVCHPYVAPRYVTVPRVRNAVIVVCVFSLAYNMPRFFERYMKSEGDSEIAYTEFSQTKFYSFFYSNVLYCIFSFFLPLVAMTCLNCRLIVAYRKILKRRAYLRGSASRDTSSSSARLNTECRSASHDNHGKYSRSCSTSGGTKASSSAVANDENNITMVMIVIVLVFILCNGPAKFVQIMWGYEDQFCPSVAFYVIELANAMEVLASSTNFIIYCALRKRFRLVLAQWLGCKFFDSKRRRSTTGEHSYAVNTTAAL